MASEMVCPKCAGAMRTYERNGVNVDQCTECRGIFLDRGELEQLLNAEEAYNQAPPARARQADVADYQRNSGSQHGSSHGSDRYPKRRKGGFLGELFD